VCIVSVEIKLIDTRTNLVMWRFR